MGKTETARQRAQTIVRLNRKRDFQLADAQLDSYPLKPAPVLFDEWQPTAIPSYHGYMSNTSPNPDAQQSPAAPVESAPPLPVPAPTAYPAAKQVPAASTVPALPATRGLYTAAAIINWVTLVIVIFATGGFGILAAAWFIPMTVLIHKAAKGPYKHTALGVCTLLFCNLISGILMLVDDSNRSVKPLS